MSLFPKVEKIRCPCCGKELVVELMGKTELHLAEAKPLKDYIDSKREALKTILLLDDVELDKKMKEGAIPRGIWENIVGRGIEQKVY